MTIDGYKSCRKLRKQVQRTDLYISYTYTIYSTVEITVPVAERLEYFPFNSYITGLFFKKYIFTERSLKCRLCHSVYWMFTEWWLKCDYNPPFPSLFSHHTVIIQLSFSRLKGEISFCASRKVKLFNSVR